MFAPSGVIVIYVEKTPIPQIFRYFSMSNVDTADGDEASVSPEMGTAPNVKLWSVFA